MSSSGPSGRGVVSGSHDPINTRSRLARLAHKFREHRRLARAGLASHNTMRPAPSIADMLAASKLLEHMFALEQRYRT